MTYLAIAFAMLFLLQIKHWYADFVLQTDYHIKNKGTYGHPGGIWHAVHHGIGTILALFLFLDGNTVLLIAVIDAVAHYHIDWAKMNWGNGDIGNPKFWHHLGLDQMAHQITYILLVFFALI